MDKPMRPGNPLIYPPDDVLMAAARLENDASFRLINGWINTCYAASVNRLPTTKEEVDFRWTQGQCQALLLIIQSLTRAKDELQSREAKAKADLLPRNI